MTDFPFIVMCSEESQFFETYPEASNFATYVDGDAPDCAPHQIFYLTPVPNLNSIADRVSPSDLAG